MNTCTKCGFTAKCGCVFERRDGVLVCKKCVAKAKGEELAADLKVEMEVSKISQTILGKQKGIEHLHGILKGRSAFLLCGGPSLAKTDLSVLNQRGIVTMAINNAAALYRPNYWIGIDEPKRFVEQLWKDAGVTKLLPSYLQNKKISQRDKNGVLGESMFTPSDSPSSFFFQIRESFDTEKFLTEDGFCSGNKKGVKDALGLTAARTTMLAAMKMLYYMGAKNVFILGADFAMKSAAQNYAFPQETSEANISSNNGIYSALNKRFTALRPHFDAQGFNVWNCTPESQLTAFQKLDFSFAVRRATNECLDKEIQTEGMYPVK